MKTSCFIVWDKDNSGDFADAELAWTSFKTATRIFKYRWNGMLQGDMKNKEERQHPTQKPVKLYEWLLTNYAKKGDRILDTHLGSGSSAIAAHNLGFDFVGMELDKNYYEAAVKRFNAHIVQATVFAPNLPIRDAYMQTDSLFDTE
jgi:site-specific DNA-methyltransferase (adenine-specific)